MLAGSPNAWGQTLVQEYFVPLPETQVRIWADGIQDLAENETIHSVISMTVTNTDTVIYFDQWENGYELELSDPLSIWTGAPNDAGTQIWGDGDLSNGCAPDLNGAPNPCAVATDDLLGAGDIVILESDVPLGPANVRDPAVVFFDGRDRFGTTELLAVTRAAWPSSGVEAQLGGAVEVFDTSQWGTTYETPIGENAGLTAFEYVGLSVMAEEDGTLVSVDANGDGDFVDANDQLDVPLNQGETLLAGAVGTTDILVGAIVEATSDVQVNMITANEATNYEGRWYSLFPRADWGNEYFSAVASTVAGDEVRLHIYNPAAAAIIVKVFELVAGVPTCTNQTVGAGASVEYTLGIETPLSAARLLSDGTNCAGAAVNSSDFFAIATVDRNATIHDWGFTLIPITSRTPTVVAGWAPGSTNLTENASPVWVTPVDGTTDIYVDFDGDPSTGALIDPFGNRYDQLFAGVVQLQAIRVFDQSPPDTDPTNPCSSGDCDQTGLRAYTIDGTRLTAAWGQDPEFSGSGQPQQLDMGTTVLPFSSITAYKSGALLDDANNNGGLDPGETILYTIRVVNTGIVPISNIDLVDTLDPNTAYVAESTQVDGGAIPDDIAPDTPFPLDADAGHPDGYALVAPPQELAPGAEILVTFVARVNDPLPVGVEDIVNNVVVSSDSETFVDADVAPLPAGEIAVSKTSSAAGAPVVPGQAITYTVTVENTSSSAVSGVTLTEFLPAEVTYVANTTQVTGPEQFFARDTFEVQSYSNQDGPNDWNGNWIETDANGPAQSPTAGDVQIFPSPGNTELRLEQTDSAAARAVGDLRTIGGPDPFAALFFDFRLNPTVDEPNVVHIECASNGPAGTFNLVPYGILDGIEGDVNAIPDGRLGFDISSCIAAPPTPPNTAIQLRLEGGYGGGEFLFADVLDVRVAGDNREAVDDLSSGGYTGGTGWATNWVENDSVGAAQDPADGNVRIVGQQIRMTGPVDESIVREVDLSGAVFAILSFDYQTSGNIDDTDRLRVEVSSTGAAGTFTALGEFVNDMNNDIGERSYDITQFMSANTAVRFRVSQGPLNTGNEFYFFDDVRVKAGVMVSDTKNNFVASTNPLVDGTPPVITVAGDSFALAPGDTMTATFDVVADSPLDVPFVINSAVATTFENPNPVRGEVIDFVGRGGAIGDLVWLDVDEDGFYDKFEPGLANVLVELRDGTCTPLPAVGANCPTTVTDVNGNYLFDHLPPGTYEVFVDPAMNTLPTGLSIAPGSTNPVSGIMITAAGEVFLDVDFGYSPDPTLGALGDYIWNDSDGDGIQDPGELGIGGVTVELRDAATGALVTTTTTGPDGKYLFTDVVPGEYFVAIAPAELGPGGDLDGYSATQGPQSIGVAISPPFTLSAGEAITDLDFGYANACLPRIDFETDSAGFALLRGQVIDDEFSNWGVAVSFTAAAPGTGPAMIFDSHVPTGGDTDLGSANQTCSPPGLGVGAGGELGQPGENCTPLGNILIISEDGDASDPDDNLNGGTLTFDFDYDVDVASIDFLDGNSPGNTVETFDANLNSLGTVAIADLGANSSQSVAVGTTGVRRLVITLDDAGAVPAIDFCASPPLHPISDTVWLDENGDGNFSPGEQAIAGVTVSLLDSAGSVVATAVSGADGKFTFPLVPDGDYTVRIDDTAAKLTSFFGTTPPAQAAELSVTMAGAPLSGINFGYYAPGNIGDLVWNDSNDNGVRDPGEPGIEGVTLDLVDAASGMVVATTTTAADGSYLFQALPVGSYTVRVTDTAMLLTGFTQTGDPSEPGVKCTVCNDAGSTTVTLNQSDLAQDFGYRNTALPEVTGTVFFDPDRDGVLDAGEPGFEGVTVTLFDAGPDGIFGTNDDLVVAETTSDTSGFYTFSDVPAGNYEVRVTDRAHILEGYTLTSGLESIPITVAAMDVSGVNFGYIRDPGTAAIGDTVWLDVNGDGVPSASEPGLSRVTVDLIDVGPDGLLGTADDVGVVASTISDANGKYVFPDLPAGNYVVDVTDTNSVLTDLTETVGTTDPSAVIRLSEGERFEEADFGYVSVAGRSVLGDRLWYDADGDGVQDPGEVGIPGIDVILIGPSCSPSCTVTTGPDGIWLAKNLLPGEYFVSFDDATLPPGYNTQPTNMPPGDDTYQVTTVAGDIITTLDFGFDGGAVGSIGDFIWLDEDGDGLQDVGEPGIEEITVNLVNASGDIIATTTTDMSGGYSFTGVPDNASYTVVVSDIKGITDLLQQTGDPDEAGVCSTCDMQGAVTIPAGGADIDTIDFAYAPSGGTGTISNFVWHDLNRDGIQDPIEPGFQGVFVELWVDVNGNGTIEPGVDNRVRTEFTDANGEYEFKSLPPEDYVVRVAPENFVSGAVLEGFLQTHDPNQFGMPCTACDNLGDLVLAAGAGNFDQDFGYAGGPVGSGLSISGTVFEDADQDTTFDDPGESPVDGATVRLYRDLDGDGILGPGDRLIDTVISGAGGAACTPPPAGIIGWWQGEGDAIDFVGPNNGTLVGGAGFAPGLVGQAFSFNNTPMPCGATDAVSIGNVFGGSAWTVEFWAQAATFPAVGAEQYPVGIGLTSPSFVDAFGNGIFLPLNQPPAVPGFHVGGAAPFTGPAVMTGQWYHLAVTSDGPGGYELFVNGLLAASGGQPPATFNDLQIGRVSRYTSPPAGGPACGLSYAWGFDGLVDEVSTYNRRLLSGEIAAIHGAGAAGKCGGGGGGATGTYEFTDLPPGNYIVTSDSSGTFVEDYLQTTQQGPSFPENGVQPVNLAGADSTGNNFGFFSGGFTTTPVTLSYFEARAGGTFRWTTSTEVGNLGFNLYAVTENGLEKLNDELIASKVVDSLEPQEYEFESRSASGEAFILEDIDVNGTFRHHGPFYVEAPRGVEATEMKAVGWGAIRAQARAAGERSKARGIHQMATSAPALSARSAPVSQGGGRPCLGCDRGRRSKYGSADLGVDREGIYRVAYEDLLAAGIDLTGASSDHLALTSGGVPVPIYVSPSASFGPGSYIEFVGEPVDTLYTKTNVYRLGVDRWRAQRVDEEPFAGAGDPEDVYLATRRFENQSQYNFAARGDDPWYDLRLLAYTGAVEADVGFDLESWVPGAAPVELDLALRGGTNFPVAPDHHLVVEVNGSQVAESWFDGAEQPDLEFEVGDGTLQMGANTITLRLPHDTGAEFDLVNYDHLTVTYPRAFVALQDALEFASDGSFFSVAGFGSSEVVAYGEQAGQVTRLGVQTQGVPGAYDASFSKPSASDERTRYWVASTAGVLAPSVSPTRRPEKLAQQKADVLVIAHESFLEGLDTWVTQRESEGLRVKVVDVADLYAEYGHGIVDPAAIRKYIGIAHASMKTRYVLLVGGDTYDYFDYLGVGSMSFVPSLYAQTDSIVYYAPVDPLYGDVDGDLIPDLAVGRWPVRTLEELEAVVDKTLEYSNAGQTLRAVMASDDRDAPTGYSFTLDSTNMAELLGSQWDVEHVSLDELSVPDARDALISGINAGPSLTSYFGHSSLSVWSFDGLFQSGDVDALTNSSSPTIVTQWGCWNTYHVLPTFETLGNRLLLEPDAGAAAVLGASTLTEALSERRLGLRLFDRLSTPGLRLGDAVTEAKRELAETEPDRLDVILGWTLLGDPTLTVVPVE